LLDLVHETLYAGVTVMLGVEVSDVGMCLQQSTHLCASRRGRPRMVLEPLVDQPMRARQDLGSSAARRDVAEEGVGLHALRGPELAGVVRVDVPTARRHAPLGMAGKGDEDGAPPFRLLVGMGFQDGVDCSEQTLASYRVEGRMILQFLQLARSLDGPGG